jgi:hypothetical protein
LQSLQSQTKKTMADSVRNSFSPENPDYAQVVKSGAIILEVRSKGDPRRHYQGWVAGSKLLLKDFSNSRIPHLYSP